MIFTYAFCGVIVWIWNVLQRPWDKVFVHHCTRVLGGDATFPRWALVGGNMLLWVPGYIPVLFLSVSYSASVYPPHPPLWMFLSVICLSVCLLSLFPGISEANKLFYHTLQICLTTVLKRMKSVGNEMEIEYKSNFLSFKLLLLCILSHPKQFTQIVHNTWCKQAITFGTLAFKKHITNKSGVKCDNICCGYGYM